MTSERMAAKARRQLALVIAADMIRRALTATVDNPSLDIFDANGRALVLAEVESIAAELLHQSFKVT